MSHNRCMVCRKKLGVIEFTCKCEKKFCISHLQPQEHKCTYDYKKDGRQEVQKMMDTEIKVDSFERMV